MMIFETERLIVRHLQPEDMDAFYAICSDPEVNRYMGDGNPLTRAQTQKWIEVSLTNYKKRGYGCSVVIEKESGALIGFCGLIYAPGSEQVEIIYAFTPSRWGKGYATEVVPAMVNYGFEQHNLPRIVATIDPANSGSVHVVTKVGFTYDHIEEDEHGLPTAWYSIERQTE